MRRPKRKKVTQRRVSMKKIQMTDAERAEKATAVLQEAQKIADNRIGSFIRPREVVNLMMKHELIERSEVWGKDMPSLKQLTKMLKDWESLK